MEAGDVKPAREIALEKGIGSRYVSRMVNMTTLRRNTVAAILDATLPPEVTMFGLAVDRPALWEAHRGRVDRTS